MINKVLFLQPFSLEKKHLKNEILIWELYLENYLKSKLPHLNYELLYLPVEHALGNITINSYVEKEKFYDQMLQLISKLKFEPDERTMVALSGTTSEHFLPSKLICEFFQNHFPESIIVFGGAHASARPYDFSYSNSPVDYVVIGEGEIIMYELIKNSAKKKDLPLIMKSNKLPELDSLPELDFSLFDKYINHFSHLSISLSRGCPYKCNFCIEIELSEGKFKPWRSYSPKRAIKEVSNMVNYGTEHGINAYGFYDPIFGMNKKWLVAFLSLYNYEEMIYAWIETRLDILGDNLLKKLIEKNFYCMFGLESYSKEMLSIMNKTIDPVAYLKKFEHVYDFQRKNQRFFMINLLFNHPGETRKSYETTFNRLDEMVLEDNIENTTLNIRFYNHFPGSHVYNNFDYYDIKYGSIAYYPEWFKNEQLLKAGPYCVRPSTGLSLRKSFMIFTERYKNLLEISKINKVRNKELILIPYIIHLQQQIKTLEINKNNFFYFLDQKEIEYL
ncbi:MAG: B12-binding domain-containing radical SAM protein [Promethearchaeota archaeon]